MYISSSSDPITSAEAEEIKANTNNLIKNNKIYFENKIHKEIYPMMDE